MQEIVLQSNLRESLHLHVARILYMVTMQVGELSQHLG